MEEFINILIILNSIFSMVLIIIVIDVIRSLKETRENIRDAYIKLLKNKDE